MTSIFDPYYLWLGIPPHEQPPNYYRLLGVELFERNLDVIATAADRQMMLLRTFQTGKHSADSQRLLNEVAAARVCLLNPIKRDDYDQQLLDAMQKRDSTETTSNHIHSSVNCTEQVKNATQTNAAESANSTTELANSANGIANVAPFTPSAEPLPPIPPATPPVPSVAFPSVVTSVTPPATITPSECGKTSKNIYEQMMQPSTPIAPVTLDQVLKCTTTQAPPKSRVAWIQFVIILISLLCIAISVWYSLNTLKTFP